eukprot:gb/GECG01011105.1/.p1 GENE.gb/GECG01011105.1/~~gb/GECG01011105.1/.p1  ORF type:complete len:104 (+),score=10.94 gb/GECG01011105.1/:1-312(+)
MTSFCTNEFYRLSSYGINFVAGLQKIHTIPKKKTTEEDGKMLCSMLRLYGYELRAPWTIKKDVKGSITDWYQEVKTALWLLTAAPAPLPAFHRLLATALSAGP